MDSPLILIPLLTGVIFILAGFLMKKYPPKTINMLYGYRTASSMKDQAHWDFAQMQACKEMIKTGIIMLIASTAGLFFEPNEGVGVALGIGFLILMSILMIFRVERSVSKKFPMVKLD